MKINNIIKTCINSKEPIRYCFFKGNDVVVYDKCVIYLLPKGSIKQIKDAKKVKLKKVDSLISQLETMSNFVPGKEDFNPAKEIERKIINNKTVLKLATEATIKWVNETYYDSFGAKCKPYFAENGWYDNEIFMVEKEKVVGMILRLDI